MKHPKTIEEISAPWMTEVLRGAGILRRATVDAVDVHAIGQGLGFLSGRARVALTYDQSEEGAPATVVVKLPATMKEAVDVAESTHAYEREIRFYREVAPRTPIRVPRMFATIMEPADNVFILVMEDLKGLTAGDQVIGMSRAQVLAAVQTIAPLHALWWNGDQRQALPWVPSVEQQLTMLSLTPEVDPHGLAAVRGILWGFAAAGRSRAGRTHHPESRWHHGRVRERDAHARSFRLPG